MIGICLVIWCLGTVTPRTDVRLTGAQDVWNKALGHRSLAIVDTPWGFGGYIYQSNTKDAVFVGGHLLKIQLHSRVRIDSGTLVATARMPRTGTKANFVARAQVLITPRIAFEYVHTSNAGIGPRSNPGIDSVGLSVRLR